MSKYTQSIYSILEQYAQPGEDITKLSDIYEIGVRDIFGEELNVISEEYRQHFVTSFLLHFFLIFQCRSFIFFYIFSSSRLDVKPCRFGKWL